MKMSGSDELFGARGYVERSNFVVLSQSIAPVRFAIEDVQRS